MFARLLAPDRRGPDLDEGRSPAEREARPPLRLAVAVRRPPVVLPREEVDILIQHAGSSTNLVTVDLPSQTVRAGNHEFTAYGLTLATIALTMRTNFHPLWMIALGAGLGLAGIV